uniref:Cell wall protein awa1 n=1 Tax=Anopheles braziliensis TaxID=58242 RepID=A0A2M3Z3R4_9DIPT
MGKSVVLLTLLYVGYAAAGSASWSEDISVHNNQAVTGIHYSQHESSVNAARRAAAERLQQQQAAALVAAGASGSCDTLCYNSYAADASDVETIGQGIVGFTSTGTTAGGAVSGASQKYSSSSSRVHESTVQNVHTAVPVPVPVPVYPATSTGSRSSFSSSSSSRHHTASQVAQPVLGQQLYATHGLEHGRTHSNVVAAGGVREGTYIQPVVYPVIAPVTHTSQSTYGRSSTVVNQRPATETVYVQVPVVDTAAVSNSNFNTRSSYVASSDQQQQVQPVLYSNAPTTGYTSRNEYASQQQDQQYRRYPAKSTTYVLYSKPVAPVGTYYAPSRSHVEDSASTTYDASGRVVNLAGAQRTLTERTDEQRTQRVQTVHDNVGRVLPETGAPLVDTYGDEVDSYGGVDRSDQHSLRIGSGAATASQRTEHQQQQQQQHQYVRTGSYVPTAPVQHTAGTASSQSRYSSSAHATESQRRQTYQQPAAHLDAPVVTHGTAGAGSSVATSEYESTLEQRRQSSGGYVPIVAQPVVSGVASSSNRYQSAHEQRSNTLAGATSGNPGGYYNGGVGAAGYGTQYAAKTSSAHSSSSSSSNRYSKTGSPSLQYYPITNDEMGRRFGGVGGSATGLGANADLEGIMSETELLAREQAQNVHNGAVTGSGTIDLESLRDDDGLSRLPGGFQKTKSWSSSSKWASEQRYGSDGKPKTYSMLSTAESEKHNINGKTTGYKAATTTLEDDGKVSTYSLHTA